LEQDPQIRLTEPEQEIILTKKKIWTAEDPDIGDALKLQLGALIGAHDKAARIASGIPLEEEELSQRLNLSPADRKIVDQLVRAAKLEASRQNYPRFHQLVSETRAIDNENPEVLELLADELIKNSNFNDAVTLLKQAKKSAPKSVSIERKLGMAAMQHGTDSYLSMEDKLRSDFSDDPLSLDSSQKASAPTAFWLTLFLPGSGHVVLGKNRKGWIIMGSWAIMVFFIFLLQDQLQSLVRMSAGRGSGGTLVTFPIVIAVIIHLYAIGELAQMMKLSDLKKGKVDRPTPPSNLPFE